jgi:hypothetical protein
MHSEHSFCGTARYRPLSRLGAGATGTVHRVYDEEIGAVVALKTLHSATPEEIYRLKSEFRSLAGIVHPNLVQLYDLHVGDDACFFTMEYVPPSGRASSRPTRAPNGALATGSSASRGRGRPVRRDARATVEIRRYGSAREPLRVPTLRE